MLNGGVNDGAQSVVVAASLMDGTMHLDTAEDDAVHRKLTGLVSFA